jgi:tetratricopeptide (TPR) repeat protein
MGVIRPSCSPVDVYSESRLQGEEKVELVADTDGSYRVSVEARLPKAAAGAYAVRLAELRVATGKEKELDPEHPKVAFARGNLAMILRNKGDLVKAEQLYLSELEILQKALGTEHPEVADTLNNLAILYAAPRLLHIATHGFFLQDGPVDSVGSNRSQTRSINANVKINNPLLRSGLALAGANLRQGGDDDGVLTALEASGLNLWGTKLVVLSACDTGVGEVKTGEGVYGLRRAFVLAGTEALVMSLWPVSDYVTREMMTNYYKGLREGRGRGEALRQVQLGLLKHKGREHPFYWAGFIQSGEWANPDGKR